MSSWFPPLTNSYKLNSDAVILNGEVGLGSIIVHDFACETMLVSECDHRLINPVKLAEVMTLHNIIVLAIDVSLYPL